MKRSGIFPLTMVSLLLTGGMTAKVNAATFNFDFESTSSFTKAGELDTNNVIDLDPYLIDGIGQDVGGTVYSTTNGNVGQIWNSIGIDITGFKKNGITPNGKPIGLFESNCVAETSNDGFTDLCERDGDGDPDLATGDGEYKEGDKTIEYDTEPQGTVLIFEENKGTKQDANGRGVPDDDGGGGVFNFEFDRNVLSSVKIDKIGLLDDVSGDIKINYLDGTFFEDEITQPGENDLTFFVNDNPDREIASLEVQFNGSGAISGLFFSEFDPISPEPVPAPEPTTILGTLASLGLGRAFKKRLTNKNSES